MHYFCNDKKFYTDKELENNKFVKVLYSGESIAEIKEKYLQSKEVEINSNSSILSIATKNKIQAIKEYREKHDCSLREAVDAVNKMLQTKISGIQEF